jgi:peptidoglycan/xylan/chitin deacetylase (PgdA/CDA1 family)
MRLFRPPVIPGLIYPEALFRIKSTGKELLLTFDDGPDPGSTEEILGILRSRQVKSVFFCCGKEAEKHPELVSRISSEGHLIGNHGFSHLNGWKTGVREYVEDASRAAEMTSGTLFRPPYGSIRPRQYNELRKEYRIIFWDLMPYDWDLKFGMDNSLMILKKKIRPGAVIALHDRKASTARAFLGEFLDFAEETGFKFVIPEFIRRGTAKRLKKGG